MGNYETKDSELNGSQHLPDFCSYFFVNNILIRTVPKSQQMYQLSFCVVIFPYVPLTRYDQFYVHLLPHHPPYSRLIKLLCVFLYSILVTQ